MLLGMVMLLLWVWLETGPCLSRSRLECLAIYFDYVGALWWLSTMLPEM